MLPAGAHWPPGGTVWAYMPATPVQVPLGAAGTTQWAWAPLRNDAAELGTVPPAWTAAAPPNLAESAAAAAREMPHRVGGAWPAAMGKDRLLVMLWSGVLRLASGMAFLGCRAHTHAQLSIRKQGLQQRTRGILVLESHTPSGFKVYGEPSADISMHTSTASCDWVAVISRPNQQQCVLVLYDTGQRTRTRVTPCVS